MSNSSFSSLYQASCFLSFSHSALFFFSFFFLLSVVLVLHCCTWASSSCGKQGLLFVAVQGLIAVASLVERSI